MNQKTCSNFHHQPSSTTSNTATSISKSNITNRVSSCNSSYNKIDEFEYSGPRPPVPGEESRLPKMTETFSDVQGRTSPPDYLKWQQSLVQLLDSSEGIALFKKYVETCVGPIHMDRLNFYFACEGLKQQSEPENIKQLISAIYRFLRKSQLARMITDELRATIKAGQKDEIKLSANFFDRMQKEVETSIHETTYPNFLQSDIYVQYVQRVQQNENLDASCLATSSGPPVPTSIAAGTSSSSWDFGALPSSSAMPIGPDPDHMARCSSALPTLHEDTELALHDDVGGIGGSQTSPDVPVRLTRDLLMKTQKRRLEVRPPGAHGYSVYNAMSSTYNPVSRQDSDRQSVSSGGITDSETKSRSGKSIDGRPYTQRRQHNSIETEAMIQNAMANKDTNKFAVIPRTQRPNANAGPLSPEDFMKLLTPKLQKISKQQELDETFGRKMAESDMMPVIDSDSFSLGGFQPPLPIRNAITTEHGKTLKDAFREKFLLDDDNDQDILDQHVSRVWSDLTPHRSPGTISPLPSLMPRRRPQDFEMLGTDGGNAGPLIRHSKSMPEQQNPMNQQMSYGGNMQMGPSTKRPINKWPSMNTDSGISLFSADATLKSSSRSRGFGDNASIISTSSQLEEARRRLEDETRRSRRYSQQSTVTPNTIAVYTFFDEELPYRLQIPGTQPTLKVFKDNLPKKGNFRFFFKTACEDPDNPVIQEEITDELQILPLFDGKIMGLVKPRE